MNLPPSCLCKQAFYLFGLAVLLAQGCGTPAAPGNEQDAGVSDDGADASTDAMHTSPRSDVEIMDSSPRPDAQGGEATDADIDVADIDVADIDVVDIDVAAHDATPGVDLEEWPDVTLEPNATLSVVYEGQLVRAGEGLALETPPAGYDEHLALTLTVTNRGAEALSFEGEPERWLTGEGLSWATPPQGSLAPESSARLELRFDPATFDEATTHHGEVNFPGAGRAIELFFEVPSPLRMVAVGEGNSVTLSDTYGASYVDSAVTAEGPERRQSVTWGNGVFLRSWAPTNDWRAPGRYAFSTDGVHWTPSTARDAFWSSACAFGLGQFTCAYDRHIAWSTSGATMIHETSSLYGQLLNDIAFADGRFVAVGRQTRTVTSLDGRDWLYPSRVEDGDWLNAVAYNGQGRWIAVGGTYPNPLTLAVSNDHGETWTSRVEPDLPRCSSIACSPSRCLMSCSAAQSLYASDDGGERWLPIEGPDWVEYRQLGWHHGHFHMAAFNNSTEQTEIYRSTDGVERTLVHTTPIRVTSLAAQRWTPGEESVRVVRLQDAQPPEPEGDDGHLADPDCEVGLVATRAGAPVREALDFGAAPTQGDFVEISIELRNQCAAPLRFLGHPDDWFEGTDFAAQGLPPVRLEPGQAASLTLRYEPGSPGSADGALRIPHDKPGSPLRLELLGETTEALRLVFVGDGRHVITTADYGQSIAYDDFETLEAHADELQRGVCAGPGLFVAVGGNIDERWWTSPDGVTWQSHSRQGAPFNGCAYGDGLYVTAGPYPSASTDGVTWEAGEHAGFNRGHFRTIAYGDGVFVAVGDDGRVGVTTQGDAWAPDLNLETADLDQIAFGDGVFVAAGAGGWVAHSEDRGQTWTTQRIADGAAVNGIVYAAGEFVLAAGGDIYRSPDGVSWSHVNAAPAIPRAALGRQIFGNNGNALYLSHDGGFSWTNFYTSPAGLSVNRAAFEER